MALHQVFLARRMSLIQILKRWSLVLLRMYFFFSFHVPTVVESTRKCIGSPMDGDIDIAVKLQAFHLIVFITYHEVLLCI